MDRSAEILFDALRTERALGEMPAIQERNRLARLASEIADCCRVSMIGRLAAAVRRPVNAARGALR